MSEESPGGFRLRWLGRPDQPAGSSQVLESLRVVVERRYVLGSCVLVFLIGAVALNWLTVPRYEAAATLQIERTAPEILTFKDMLSSDGSYFDYEYFYVTQYELIRGRKTLELAAQRIDLERHPDFLKRKSSPISRALRRVRSLWQRPGSAGAAKPASPHSRAVRFISDNLTVEPIHRSRLVRVSFLDPSPELARAVANAVVEAYQQLTLEEGYSTANLATEFLTKEVARLQAEIAEREKELYQYASDRAAIDVHTGESTILDQALAELNSQLSVARGQSAALRAKHEQLRDTPDAFIHEVADSPLIGYLKRQLAELEQQQRELAQRFKSDWPARVALEQRLDEVRSQLTQETARIADQVRGTAKAAYDESVVEVAHLERQVSDQSERVRRARHEAVEYASLRSEIETRRQVLKSLVERENETETSGNLRQAGASNVRIVEPALLPSGPSRPRKLRNLSVALFAGLSFGLALAFLLHGLDDTIKDEADLQRYAPDVPLLGHASQVDTRLRALSGGEPGGSSGAKPEEAAAEGEHSVELMSHWAPRSPFAESFRSLRTSLLLASADGPPRFLLVTSCEPRDGKSTVAVNLATVLSQTGARVLLIDADLRRPRIAGVLGASSALGLSNYLAGSSRLDELIQSTAIPGLDVVASGPIPPNPSELIGSRRFAELRTELERRRDYAHVLFDSPPVVHVTDSLLLADRVDKTILVVRSGATSRKALAIAIARVRQARVDLLGALLNGRSHVTGYYQRHYYGSDDTRGDGSSWIRRAVRGGRGPATQGEARRRRSRAG